MRTGSAGVVFGAKYVAKKTTSPVPSFRARWTSFGCVAKDLPTPYGMAIVHFLAW